MHFVRSESSFEKNTSFYTSSSLDANPFRRDLVSFWCFYLEEQCWCILRLSVVMYLSQQKNIFTTLSHAQIEFPFDFNTSIGKGRKTKSVNAITPPSSRVRRDAQSMMEQDRWVILSTACQSEDVRHANVIWSGSNQSLFYFDNRLNALKRAEKMRCLSSTSSGSISKPFSPSS